LFGLTILVFALLGQAVTGDMVSGSRVSHARLAQYSSAFPICHAGEPGRPDRRQSPPHRSCAICPFCFANAQLATLPPPQGHQFECGWRMSLYRLERMRPLHGGTPKYTRPDRPF
jgi:hypothetical protein